jgi:hypothetical protein
MKRSRTNRPIKRTGNVRKDMTKTQLAAIGAVSLAYNEAERVLDILLGGNLGLISRGIGLTYDLTSRINGIDGKVAIIKSSLTQLSVPRDTLAAVADTLGEAGFSLYKKYRDAIIHSISLDAKAGISAGPYNRGKSSEVLVTPAALNGLYRRLVIIRSELFLISGISTQALTKFELTQHECPICRAYAYPTRPVPSLFVKEIRGATALIRKHQKRRLSLAPLPEFPA